MYEATPLLLVLVGEGFVGKDFFTFSFLLPIGKIVLLRSLLFNIHQLLYFFKALNCWRLTNGNDPICWPI
jgi:hypothetical protein